MCTKRDRYARQMWAETGGRTGCSVFKPLVELLPSFLTVCDRYPLDMSLQTLNGSTATPSYGSYLLRVGVALDAS